VPAPVWPGVCNITYDSQSSFNAQNRFGRDNTECITKFADCLAAGGGTNSSCNGPCTANIDLLQSACDNTYCEVVGSNPMPANQNVPPFHIRTAGCYPDACDNSQHAAVQASWRYTLCGNALWSTPDCATIVLNCAYSLPPSTVWIIVGSVLAAFVVCAGGLSCAYYYFRRKHGGLEEEVVLANGDVLVLGYADTPHDEAPLLGRGDAGTTLITGTDRVEDTMDPMPSLPASAPGSSVAGAGGTSTAGYTYVDMRRPGATQMSIMDADSDRL